MLQVRNVMGTLAGARSLLLPLAGLGACLAVCCGIPAVAQDYPLADPVPEPLPPEPPAGVVTVSPLSLLGEHVLPGSRATLAWRTGQNYFGADLESPVLVAHGARPGPVLCLVAGVHGDEINGVETVRRVMTGLQPAALSGTVIGVPVVNLFGYQRSSRYLPDRRDLNRFFPGSRNGSIASRIAFSFFQDVVQRCDALVDFHTGSFDRANLPQVRANLNSPRILDLARGFGSTVVLHSAGSRGMLRTAASEAGIPAVTFEAGAPARLQENEIGTVAAAIERLMQHLGMVDGVGPAPLASQAGWVEEMQPVFYASRWLRAEHGGLLISEVALGEMVDVGQRLGRIIDPLSNQVFEVRSSLSGRMLGMAENQQVLPGFALYHVGLMTTEREAVIENEAIDFELVEDEETRGRPREPSADPEPEDG
ncbi:MAG: succinylglutamate desuccinylase/aspartoacylase family protein [Xanthomonadaceae bacterium]|nr:succinylglutamate desuccinylase/aspartoacylase family protein [Xanthomonadaceae bacterium]